MARIPSIACECCVPCVSQLTCYLARSTRLGNQFFTWTLTFLKSSTGSGLDEVFRKYDLDGSGTLSAMEFSYAAEDIGLGELAHEIFTELDNTNVGYASAQSVLKLIKSPYGISRNAKRLMTELAFYGDRPESQMDTSSWQLTGESKELIRAELLLLMRDGDPPGRVSQLFRAMTENYHDDVDAQVLYREDFDAAMARVGLPPPGNGWLVEAVFRQIDVKDSGCIRLPELRAWINGCEMRKALARRLTFRSRPGGSALQLGELEWSPAVLREQMQLMLIANNLGPIDLCRAYDTAGDDTFSKRNILGMCKILIDDMELWDQAVRDVVVETYEILMVSAAKAYSLLMQADDFDASRDKQRNDEKAKARAVATKIKNAKGIPSSELIKFLQGGWAELKQASVGEGMPVRRKPPPPVARPPPMIGDPRWPNRVWPGRRTSTAYARRQLYRPPPDLKGTIAPPPETPMMPPGRHTGSSNRHRHFISTREAHAVWKEAVLHRSRSAPRLVTHYVQAGGAARMANGEPRIAYGGISGVNVATYRRPPVALPLKEMMRGASATGIRVGMQREIVQ